MAPPSRRRTTGAQALLAFVAAYAAQWGGSLVMRQLYRAWASNGSWDGHPVYWFLTRVLREGLDVSGLFLGAGTVFALGLVLTRVLRRAPTGGDVPSPWSVRGLAERYPRIVYGLLPVVFGGLWFLAASNDFRLSTSYDNEPFQMNWGLVGHAVASILAAVAAAIATRTVVAALDREPAATPAAGSAAARPLDDSTFTAVAVTRTTRGLVGAMGLVSLAMTAFVIVAPRNSQLGPAVIAYVLAALGAATLFRYVSRVVVGIDGMLVTGAGRTRLFGYAMFDEVREQGSEILLLRAERVLVRLQLPAEETPRIGALVARLRSAMAHAASLRNGGADLMMQIAQRAEAPSDALAASSRGGGNYRQPTMAREQLWELIEGPLADGAARTVAAQALAPDLDAHDRARLRVAAEHSADPRVRIALKKLAGSEEPASEADDDDAGVTPKPAMALPTRR